MMYSSAVLYAEHRFGLIDLSSALLVFPGAQMCGEILHNISGYPSSIRPEAASPSCAFDKTCRRAEEKNYDKY